MLDSGLGETHINKFLASLGVHPVHQKTFKKREREIGYHIEGLSKESCQAALTEEGTFSLRSYSATSDSTQNPLPIDIDVSYDAGWQRRGSGRSYNSLFGQRVLDW